VDSFHEIFPPVELGEQAGKIYGGAGVAEDVIAKIHEIVIIGLLRPKVLYVHVSSRLTTILLHFL
jgi:hypothetical protein